MAMIEFVIFWVIIYFVLKRRREKRKGGNMTGNGSVPNVTVSSAPKAAETAKQSFAEETRQDGNSTTAYLTGKAAADEQEHRKEKQEEQRRINAARGGFAVAERLYDGDLVPQGKRCVVCSYCGAENLVPAAGRMEYSCYFCREPLGK